MADGSAHCLQSALATDEREYEENNPTKCLKLRVREQIPKQPKIVALRIAL